MTTSDFEDSRAQLGGVEGFSYDTDDLLDGAELDEAMITPDGVARGDKHKKSGSRGIGPGMVGGQGGSTVAGGSSATGGSSASLGTGGAGSAGGVSGGGVNTAGLSGNTGLSAGGLGSNAGNTGISGIGTGSVGVGGAGFAAGGANPRGASLEAIGAPAYQVGPDQFSSYQPGAFLSGPVAASSFAGGGIDTDGDGIPDLFDYDPHTPGIQTRDGQTYTGPLPPGYVVSNPGIVAPSGGIDTPSYTRYETPTVPKESFYDNVSSPSMGVYDPSVLAGTTGDWTSSTTNPVGSVPQTYAVKPPADVSRTSVPVVGSVRDTRGVRYSNAATSDMSVSTASIDQASDQWRGWAEEMASISAKVERTRLQWDQYGFIYQPYSSYSSLQLATSKWTKEAEGSFADISGGLSNTSNSYSTTEQQSAASADSIQGMM